MDMSYESQEKEKQYSNSGESEDYDNSFLDITDDEIDDTKEEKQKKDSDDTLDERLNGTPSYLEEGSDSDDEGNHRLVFKKNAFEKGAFKKGKPEKKNKVKNIKGESRLMKEENDEEHILLDMQIDGKHCKIIFRCESDISGITEDLFSVALCEKNDKKEFLEDKENTILKIIDYLNLEYTDETKIFVSATLGKLKDIECSRKKSKKAKKKKKSSPVQKEAVSSKTGNKINNNVKKIINTDKKKDYVLKGWQSLEDFDKEYKRIDKTGGKNDIDNFDRLYQGDVQQAYEREINALMKEDTKKIFGSKCGEIAKIYAQLRYARKTDYWSSSKFKNVFTSFERFLISLGKNDPESSFKELKNVWRLASIYEKGHGHLDKNHNVSQTQRNTLLKVKTMESIDKLYSTCSGKAFFNTLGERLTDDKNKKSDKVYEQVPKKENVVPPVKKPTKVYEQATKKENVPPVKKPNIQNQRINTNNYVGNGQHNGEKHIADNFKQYHVQNGGYSNGANHCYLLSLLIFWLHNKHFKNIIDGINDNNTEGMEIYERSFLIYLKELCKRLVNGTGNQGKTNNTAVANTLVACLNRICSRINIVGKSGNQIVLYGQNDSHEFNDMFMPVLQYCLSKVNENLNLVTEYKEFNPLLSGINIITDEEFRVSNNKEKIKKANNPNEEEIYHNSMQSAIKSLSENTTTNQVSLYDMGKGKDIFPEYIPLQLDWKTRDMNNYLSDVVDLSPMFCNEDGEFLETKKLYEPLIVQIGDCSGKDLNTGLEGGGHYYCIEKIGKNNWVLVDTFNPNLQRCDSKVLENHIKGVFQKRKRSVNYGKGKREEYSTARVFVLFRRCENQEQKAKKIIPPQGYTIAKNLFDQKKM